MLAGSRRERPGALHIAPVAELRIDLEGVLEEVHRNALVGEEGDRNLVGELYSRLVMIFWAPKETYCLRGAPYCWCCGGGAPYWPGGGP